MIKKKYLFLTFLFFSSLNVFAMEDKIEINGESKPLIGHIVFAMTFEPDHLKNIDFIRYEEEDKYVMLAQGKPDLSEEDIRQINEKNFVYMPFYTMEKRGGWTYENIGAVVIGTKDKEMAEVDIKHPIG